MSGYDQEKITFGEAQIGAVKIHYAKAGEGEKLIVLLHGFPEFWYSWRHQLAGLSDDYTVVAPDLRGFNRSDKPKNVSDYDIAKIADDVIGLIHHFGREKAAVIGHDWGAAVVWELAAQHPETLWKAGALQVPPPSVLKKNYSLRQFLASWYMFFFSFRFCPKRFLRLNDYAALAEGLRRSTVERGVFTDADISEYKKVWSEPGALTAMLNYYRANALKLFFGKRETQQKITVPTVFIYGEQDQAILPESVKGIGAEIDAPYEEFHIPSSGHWVQQEAAETVTEILREFLAEKTS